MNWINVSTVFAVIASVLVFLQGWSILITSTAVQTWEQEIDQEADHKHISFQEFLLGSLNWLYHLFIPPAERKVSGEVEKLKIIGYLTILLAALAIIINLLFITTDIAISPEFGVFIVQGAWPVIFFSFCLLGLIWCVALGWNLARIEAGWKSWGGSIYLWGVLVFVAGASILFKRINAPGLNEEPVYLYDIWWPPLLLWLTIGFTDIALTIVKVDDLTIRRLASSAMAIIVIGIASFIKPFPDFANPWTGVFWTAVGIFLLITLFFELFGPLRMVRKRKTGSEFNALPWHFSKYSAHRIKKHQALMLASLAVIAVGVIFLLFFSSSLIGPATGIIIILIGWGWMTEVVTDGWFHKLYLKYKGGAWRAEGGSLDKATTAARDGIMGLWAQLGKTLSLSPNWTAIIKLLLLVILLVALNEMQNRGKTIIQPFKAIGIPATDNVVDSADGRLINDLAILNHQLQPIIIFPTSGIVKKRIDYVQAGNLPAIDAALNNSAEFDLGAVKLPANVLVAPIQGLVRPWLKVRVVNGSIISNADQYILLVNASDGSTWMAVPDPRDGLDFEKELPKLVEQMAFLMLSSEESVQSYGLTKDWNAFQSFREGLNNIQSYANDHDYDSLGAAINNFRQATRRDPDFALAYYRLGLALQQNRQPWQAEDALRMGISLNPESIPLKNALAYHLYFFDSYTPLYPAVVHTPDKLSETVKKEKREQARQLWHEIVSLQDSQVLPADSASAYLGLCNAAMEANQIYLAYFYCFKSHTLLERLPKDEQSQDKIRQADASALSNLGVIIRNKDFSSQKIVTGWSCDNGFLGDEEKVFGYHPAYVDGGKVYRFHPPYVRTALRYYEKALLLQPGDSTIQCNAAIAALLLGKDQRMRELERTAQAHFVLGSNFLEQAKKEPEGEGRPSPNYRRALMEYKRAIDLNPTFDEALNGFAYTYWVFRLRWPEEDLATLGIEHVDKLAEYYADKAWRLANLQQKDNSEEKKDDYLKIVYGRTKAEVSITNGDFLKAMDLLLRLKLPDSYVLDETRWDLAQDLLCIGEVGNGEVDKAGLEEEARTRLEKIQKNEEELETYVFSFTGNQYLTDYRLPCSQFASARAQPPTDRTP